MSDDQKLIVVIAIGVLIGAMLSAMMLWACFHMARCTQEDKPTPLVLGAFLTPISFLLLVLVATSTA